MANEGIKSLSILDKDYLQWIKELSTRFRRSQVKASVRVNQVMLQFYWELGRDIVEKKAESRWGSGFMKNLSRDLKEVNPDADVPTIYEYVTAIAWYYISNKTIDVYDSLNLTMNANFEPIRHASGNKGDIVIEENNRVTMLEVTLLTGSAQDTNEYQPVLKHSCDLKVEYADKSTITFFISCSLYTPTVFNWRNDYTTSKMAPATCTIVNNVVIMSFTSEEICMFIENNVTNDLIIQRTREAFANNVLDNNWRNDIINSLLS